HERHEVDRAAFVEGVALAHPPRPGDVRVDQPALGGGEEVAVRLVAEDRQAGLLMEYLAAEGVDHADGAVPDRPHDRVVEPALVDQLADQHALVDEVDLETLPRACRRIASPDLAVAGLA